MSPLQSLEKVLMAAVSVGKGLVEGVGGGAGVFVSIQVCFGATRSKKVVQEVKSATELGN